ncbi:MAG: fimbrillin family protein [Bacteroidaceae bacterium]|nr:fimbrillin family protein [Bacteroidaceae bacterium]
MNRKEGRYKDSLLSLLMLFITVPILTSCDRENIDFAEKIPISFTGSVETKALISDVTGIQTTGIGVTAYIQQGNTYAPIMKNQQVTYSNGNWTYSPVSYWSKSDNYIFTAYAPFSSNPTTDLAARTMTFSGIPQYQSVMTDNEIERAIDILTDTKSGSYQSEFSNGKVQFELKHELAYLEIRAVKADIASMRNVVFKVASLDLGDTENQMAKSDDRTFIKNVLDNSQSNWSSVNYQNEGKYSITSIDGQQEIPNETVNSPLVLAKMLVAPFEFGGDANPHSLAFQITYNKDDGQNDPTTHDITGHAVTINKFEAGKKYIVTLRFNTASKVEINTVVVENWTTGSTYEPPVFNW